MIKHIHVDKCDSTQEVLKEQLIYESETSFIISCEQQLMGRGRGSNVWQDSIGTICLSMNIKAHNVVSFTALEISLIVCRFFEIEGSTLRLKWPNDLLNKKGKKCGGILIQSAGDKFLAGIGVNLFYPGEEFGGVYESDFVFDKRSWAHEIGLFVINNRYPNTHFLKRDWEMRCSHMNQQVTITDGANKLTGEFIGLGEYGEALIKSDKETKCCFNGSLTHH